MSHAIELFPGCMVTSIEGFLDAVCGQEATPGPIEAETMRALTGQDWEPEAMEQLEECMGSSPAPASTWTCFLGGFWVATTINPFGLPSNVWKRAAFNLFLMEA